MSAVQSGTQPVAQAAANFGPGMDSALAIMVQDYNGDNVYSNTRALAGYLEPSKYMLLPEDFYNMCEGIDWDPVDLQVVGSKDGLSSYLGQEGAPYRATNPFLRDTVLPPGDSDRMVLMLKITALNYIQLVNSGVKHESSMAAACLRARWCLTGAAIIALNDDHGMYNEIVPVKSSHPTYGSIVSATTKAEVYAALGNAAQQFEDGISSENYGSKWAIGHAENIWCAVEYCFKVRGHHFKTTGSDGAAYEKLYERFMTACYEGSFTWPASVEMFDIFHTAIHPFKVRALPVMAVHYISHSLVANAAMIRFSGAPCGHAALTTTVAALDTMKSEVWWSAFVANYGGMIDMAAAATDAILSNKYAFHIASRLYGVPKQESFNYNQKVYGLDEAKSSTSGLAAAAQGMINGLQEMKESQFISDYALSNAKSLAKPAAQNPMLAVRLTQIIRMSINDIGSAKDMSDALKRAMLAPKEEKAKSSDGA